jgi:two-component system cell cycle sensor histidine kinase/response regulator CckA
MPRKSGGPVFRVSKPPDSKGGLLKAPPTRPAEDPSIGGRLPTPGVWQLLEGKPEASPASKKRRVGKPRSAPTKPTTKLLVVDGDPAQMEILRDNLEPRGFGTTCMTSAVEALAALREQAFDLILTDLNMPEMDGIAFMQRAREIDPDLVGIIMTGVEEDNAARAIEAGALDYIVKPFKLAAVLPVLARALSVRQLRLKNIHLQQAVGIYELSMVIQLTLDFDAVLQKIADAAMGHNQVSGVSIMVPIEDGKKLRVAVTRGDNAARDEAKCIPFSRSVSLWVERSLKRVSRLNELADIKVALPLSLPRLPGGNSVAMLSGGRFVGILNFTSKNPGRPVSAEQIKAMNVLAGAGAGALESAALHEKLRAAEIRYRSLAEGAGDIIIRYELYQQPHVSYVNPAFASVTGYSPDEIYADPGLILKMVHPDDRPLKEAVLRGDFAQGSMITLRCVNRKGDTVWIEQRNTRVEDPDGRLIAVEGVARDITERRKLEEQLRQSQKMEAIGLLAGGVAHDFNNMLTVIIGYSELILEEDAATAGIVEKVGQVKKAAQNAAELTRQLLAFGRRQLVQPRVLDVNTIVESNSKMLRRSIGEDVELVTTLAAGLGPVKTDAGQIEQILMNLVVNAKHAMPLGGKITIETRNVKLDEPVEAGDPEANRGLYVMLAVTDTGCGMDAATQTRIFEPFYTTKELGKGTGLGLSIIYGIVKQSRGHIRVVSEPGHGARFEILLPRSGEMETSPELPASELPIASETILVVEDEPGVRELIGTVLKNAGYKVLLAGDGNEALRICEENKGRIGLVLTDMIMPGMSGPTLIESLSRLSPGMRVLYMSGHAGDVMASDRGLNPSIPFLQKPFNSVTLTGKVREALDSGAARNRRSTDGGGV